MIHCFEWCDKEQLSVDSHPFRNSLKRFEIAHGEIVRKTSSLETPDYLHNSKS